MKKLENNITDTSHNQQKLKKNSYRNPRKGEVSQVGRLFLVIKI